MRITWQAFCIEKIFQRRATQAINSMSASNYKSIIVRIRPTEEFGIYEFSVENIGDTKLWHISFPTYELLGPSDFNLDDNHMPEPLTSEPPALIAHLAPGASIAFTRSKWGPLNRYRGPISGAFYLTYSPHENNEQRVGARGEFIVIGATEDHILTSFASQHPVAFRLGKLIGGFVSKLLRKTHH